MRRATTAISGSRPEIHMQRNQSNIYEDPMRELTVLDADILLPQQVIQHQVYGVLLVHGWQVQDFTVQQHTDAVGRDQAQLYPKHCHAAASHCPQAVVARVAQQLLQQPACGVLLCGVDVLGTWHSWKQQVLHLVCACVASTCRLRHKPMCMLFLLTTAYIKCTYCLQLTTMACK